MEHLLLEYLKDKPAIRNAYYRYKSISVNVILLVMLGMAIIAKTETMKSFSFGIAAGIVLITLGQNVSDLRVRNSKKAND